MDKFKGTRRMAQDGPSTMVITVVISVRGLHPFDTRFGARAQRIVWDVSATDRSRASPGPQTRSGPPFRRPAPLPYLAAIRGQSAARCRKAAICSRFTRPVGQNLVAEQPWVMFEAARALMLVLVAAALVIGEEVRRSGRQVEPADQEGRHLPPGTRPSGQKRVGEQPAVTPAARSAVDVGLVDVLPRRL